MSGLNQHTANVPNRKVPNVRNRLQRAQKPSLLGLCRASGDFQRNPSASRTLARSAEFNDARRYERRCLEFESLHESQHWRFGRLLA